MSLVEGSVLLDKAEGISSHNALHAVKRTFRESKVGHSGTLDPFASGLLIALVGRLTKLSGWVTQLDKTYEAVFRFGTETDTLDPEGEITARAAVPSLETIERFASGFRGAIRQTVPAYSAVHVGGERAYRRARAGERLSLPERTVHVRDIMILDWAPPDLSIRIQASSGTYIRAIARDLGRQSGSVAYVAALRRTSVGAFSVDEAVGGSSEVGADDLLPAYDFVSRLPGFSRAFVSQKDAARVRNGGILRRAGIRFEHGADAADGESVAVFDEQRRLLAVGSFEVDRFRYRFACG